MSDRSWRGPVGTVILAVMALSAAYGGGFFGLRERFPPPASLASGDAFRAIDGAAAERVARRSAPYWRGVRRFSGTGATTTPSFDIDRRALQWRAAWRCRRGAFGLQPVRPGGDAVGHRLATAGTCPRRGTGLSVAQGSFRLRVRAADRWAVAVEEQVDDPVVQPRPAALGARGTRVLGRGTVYGIDETGEGRVVLTRLADGSGILSLERFYVTPNVDLEIRLSVLERPRTTRQVTGASFRDVRFLTTTAGTMHLPIPAAALRDDVRSVVIWCEITHNAYAAASLRG